MIYTVTTLKTIYGYRNPAHTYELGCRCVGFFYKLEDAMEAVKGNHCDIYEAGYYPFCVIEAVEQGFYNFNNEWWYQWKLGGYKEIEKPEVLKQTYCFGIG
jgi:hypothetical protein